MDITHSYPQPHPQTAGRLIDGEAVVMLADSAEIQVYNEVGSRIFELCSGERSIAQIAEQIVAEYNIERERAQSDVVEFVRELVANQVLVLTTK